MTVNKSLQITEWYIEVRAVLNLLELYGSDHNLRKLFLLFLQVTQYSSSIIMNRNDRYSNKEFLVSTSSI